jgi:hypothetical protein
VYCFFSDFIGFLGVGYDEADQSGDFEVENDGYVVVDGEILVDFDG